LITYYLLSRNNNNSPDWDITINGDQLDVIFEENNDFTLVECKIDSNNIDLDKEINKLKEKLNHYETNKNKKCEFWFWHRPSPITIGKLATAGIHHEVFGEKIKTDPNWRNKKLDRLKLIFGEKTEFSNDSITVETYSE
jgi:hypothetical protein